MSEITRIDASQADHLVVGNLVQAALPADSGTGEWALDALLRALERDIVHSAEDPARFARICGAACDGVRAVAGLPGSATLLLLGQVNGLRRTTPLPEDVVRELLIEARQEAEGLPESHLRKERLLELVNYHMEVFSRRIGDFALAAQAAEQAAELAQRRGAHELAAICRFAAVVERANAAIFSGTAAESALVALCAASCELAVALAATADPDALRWRDAVRPMHVLSSHLWVGCDYAQREADEAQMLGLTGDLGKQFAGWVKVFAAAKKLRDGAAQEAQALVEGVIRTGDITLTVVATARLVRARALLAQGLTCEAGDEIRELVAIGEPGAQQVQAVARRELSAR